MNIKKKKKMNNVPPSDPSLSLYVEDGPLEKVKILTNYYYRILQKNESYNRNNCFSFHRYTSTKEEFDFIFSKISIIIEDLISSKSVNQKLSKVNKKLIEKIDTLEKVIENGNFNSHIDELNNFKLSNKHLVEDNKKLIDRLNQLENNNYVKNEKSSLEFRLNDTINRIVDIENWIKQTNFFLSKNQIFKK